MRLGRKMAIAAGLIGVIVLSGVLFVAAPRDLRPRSGVIGVRSVSVYQHGAMETFACEQHPELCDMIDAALNGDRGAFRGRLSIVSYAPRVRLSGEHFTMTFLEDGIAINSDRDGDGGRRTQVVREMTASDAGLLEAVLGYASDRGGGE